MMPAELAWYIPNEVIAVSLSGQVSLQDFQEVDQHVIPVLNEAELPLYMVIDASMAFGLPTVPRDIMNELTCINHPNLSWALVVTTNKLLRFIFAIAFQLAQARIRFFSSLSEVEQFLDHSDE